MNLSRARSEEECGREILHISCLVWTILFNLFSSSIRDLTLACGKGLTISNIPLHQGVITLQRFRLRISLWFSFIGKEHEINHITTVSLRTTLTLPPHIRSRNCSGQLETIVATDDFKFLKRIYTAVQYPADIKLLNIYVCVFYK